MVCNGDKMGLDGKIKEIIHQESNMAGSGVSPLHDLWENYRTKIWGFSR
jgi:hypothetical protein